jgi:hypothetical protein
MIFQAVFKPNSLDFIVIKVQVHKTQTALCSVTAAKTLAMSRPIASNALDVCGVLVATCIRNALKRQTEPTPSFCNCTLEEEEKPHIEFADM